MKKIITITIIIIMLFQMITVLSDNGYTNDELCKMASAYYKAINGVAPPIVDIDREEGDNVVLHLYEFVTDHTATWAWYEINRYTGTGADIIFGEYIDLSPYAVKIIHEESNKPITVKLNGNNINFDQPPIIINDRTLVPLRAIFDAMGATVKWEESTQTVISTLGTTIIQLSIGDNILYKNSSPIILDVPPSLINDRTMVPVRVIAESFGASVGWNDEEQTVLIKTYDYDKILNGDLSDFVGLWKNAEGYTIELDEYGEKNDPVYDEGKAFYWKSYDFRKENGCYYWSEVLDMGYYGESYVIYLFPIGVEIFNPYKGEVVPSDISRIRLYAGQGAYPEMDDIFYLVN